MYSIWVIYIHMGAKHMTTTAMQKSLVIYEGPSLHDGQTPIVVIAVRSARNRKTGDMVQTYILLRDIDPRDANKTGKDAAICGACPHRGTPTQDPARKLAKNRSCYVNIAQGVLIVWRHFQKGGYQNATSGDQITALADDAMVRLGTYGDPSMVPSEIWDTLLQSAKGRTGYTHQAENPNADFRPDLTMVSVDGELAAFAAWSKGHRTFRVLAAGHAPVQGKEILCPSPLVKCTDCGLCTGIKPGAKSIAIAAHGPGKHTFNRIQAA